MAGTIVLLAYVHGEKEISTEPFFLARGKWLLSHHLGRKRLTHRIEKV